MDVAQRAAASVAVAVATASVAVAAASLAKPAATKPAVAVAAVAPAVAAVTCAAALVAPQAQRNRHLELYPQRTLPRLQLRRWRPEQRLQHPQRAASQSARVRPDLLVCLG